MSPLNSPGSATLPDRTSTVAIVTTFHPEPGLIDRISPIVAQVRRVLVVDNGSSTPEQGEIRALQDRGEVEVLWNEQNLGLSAALNTGLAWAIERGASWALLLDQDSENVAAIGAGFVGQDVGAADSPGWQEASAVIRMIHAKERRDGDGEAEKADHRNRRPAAQHGAPANAAKRQPPAQHHHRDHLADDVRVH